MGPQGVFSSIMLYSALYFNQYVSPIALGNIHWRYYIFYCCFLAVEVAVIWFSYVEARYVPLEEIIKLFDGDDIVAAVTNVKMKSRRESGKGFNAAVHIEEAR